MEALTKKCVYIKTNLVIDLLELEGFMAKVVFINRLTKNITPLYAEKISVIVVHCVQLFLIGTIVA